MKAALIILLLALATSAYAGVSAEYASTTSSLATLSESQYVRTLPTGHSVTGRPIKAWAISDFSVPVKEKNRVLIISGQHGNEINPVKALVSFAKNLAEGVYPGVLRSSIVIIVPVVNPDGLAAKTRYNALGMDINRCWNSLETSENKFVHELIRKLRPQIMIDAHEWTETPELPGNGIELAWSATESQRKSMAGVANKVDQVAGLTQIECRRESNPALFHRRYSRLGYAAYLIETKPSLTYLQKETAYKRAFLCAITELSHAKNSSALSPASAGWSADMAAGLFGDIKPPAIKKSLIGVLGWTLGPCLGCYLLLILMKPKKKKPLQHHRSCSQLHERELRQQRSQELFSRNRYTYRS